VIIIKSDESSAKMFINGANVNAQDLPAELRRELATRAHWEVFVDADESVQFATVMYVIDTVQSLHAKAVMMTPSLRKEIAEECTHE
jgi:biopolymer transport protein ExbD